MRAAPRRDEPICFDDWDWGIEWSEAFDKIMNEAVSKGVSDVIKATFRDDPPTLSFDFIYGREGDPGELTIGLPLRENDAYQAEFFVPLSMVVDGAIQTLTGGDGFVDAETHALRLAPIAQRLRDAADKIDAALDTSPRP